MSCRGISPAHYLPAVTPSLNSALPITCADDVIEIIAPDLLDPQTSLALGNNPLETKIISLLQDGMRDGDQIFTEYSAGTSDFSTTLTMMEIMG